MLDLTVDEIKAIVKLIDNKVEVMDLNLNNYKDPYDITGTIKTIEDKLSELKFFSTLEDKLLKVISSDAYENETEIEENAA